MKHTVDLLDDALAGKLLKHLLRYVNDENPETDDLLLKVAFEPIKRQLKRDLVDWEETRVKRVNSGHLGGIKSGESRRTKQTKQVLKIGSKQKQVEANEAVNVNDNVNVNVIATNSSIIQNMETWDGVKKKWGQDFRWKEKVCAEKKITMTELHKKMVEFISGIELKEDYKNIPGLKNHFVNWYNKHHNGHSGNSAKSGTSAARIEAASKF